MQGNSTIGENLKLMENSYDLFNQGGVGIFFYCSVTVEYIEEFLIESYVNFHLTKFFVTQKFLFFKFCKNFFLLL